MLDVTLKPAPRPDSTKSMRIGLTLSNNAFSIIKFIFRSVSVMSLSCCSSRAMPSLGPPHPSCKSILIACRLCCFVRNSFSTRLASCVTSNMIFTSHCCCLRSLPEKPLTRIRCRRTGEYRREAKPLLQTRPLPYRRPQSRGLAACCRIWLTFFQFFRVGVHIDIDGPVAVGRTCLVTERARIGAVNDNFPINHLILLSFPPPTTA